MSSRRKKYVHEGQYVAEVDIEVFESETGWSPLISVEDACKLDDIRDALHKGDLKRAAKLAPIFVMAAVTA